MRIYEVDDLTPRLSYDESKDALVKEWCAGYMIEIEEEGEISKLIDSIRDISHLRIQFKESVWRTISQIRDEGFLSRKNMMFLIITESRVSFEKLRKVIKELLKECSKK